MLPANIEEYARPGTVREAVGFVAKYDEGDALFIAGGQSVMQAIKARIMRPTCVIDLQGIEELKKVTITGAITEIGAMTRYVDIVEKMTLHPSLAALQDACAHVGDRQVRNRGTIGGSICWNYMASCVPTVFLALQGTVTLSGQNGDRTVDACDFFLGPLETARKDDEILTKVTLKHVKRTASAYQKWGLVKDALPVVGVAVSMTLDRKGRCDHLTVAIAGLPAGGQLTSSALDSLKGWSGEIQPVDRTFSEIADHLEVHSDLSASEDYRRELIRKIGREVCLQARERALKS